MSNQDEEGTRNIVFFDVETTIPFRFGQGYELLEFGAVVLDGHGLFELHSFHTLIRPKDLSAVNRRTTECNGITQEMVASAPSFSEVANTVFDLLHGQIWAGHNILNFDNLRVSEAFAEIGQAGPQPFGVIDTYPLLKNTFGKRAGNYKLQSLANYCGFGKQEHRSLSDVRMNVDVLRSCATLLFLESNYPDIFPRQEDAFSCKSASKHYSRSGTKFDSNQISGITELMRRSKLTPVCESSNTNVTDEATEYQSSTFQNCSNDGVEKAITPDKIGFFKNDCFQETAVTHYEQIDEKKSVAEIMVAGFEECASQSCDDIIIHSNGILDVERDEIHEENHLPTIEPLESEVNSAKPKSFDLSESMISMLVKDAHDLAAVDSLSPFRFKVHSGDLKAQNAPFLAANEVSLGSIEVREETSYLGFSNKVLYYEGFPFQLREDQINVRFTVNPSYAIDERGKPKFSILIEPSKAACEVIRKCEELAKSKLLASSNGSDIEWLPTLRNEAGAWATRMSIGTKGTGSIATYTTTFSCSTEAGLKNIALDPVDVSTFRNVVHHGSIVDVSFSFYIFEVNNRAGLRLLAKHITVHEK